VPSLAWRVKSARQYLENYSSIATLLQTLSVISPSLILFSYPDTCGSVLFFHAFPRADTPERCKRSDSHAHGFSRHSLEARLAFGASGNMRIKRPHAYVDTQRADTFHFNSRVASLRKATGTSTTDTILRLYFFGGFRDAFCLLVSYRTLALRCRIAPNSSALCSIAGQLTTEANDQTYSDTAASLSSHAGIKHSARSTTLQSDRSIPAKNLTIRTQLSDSNEWTSMSGPFISEIEIPATIQECLAVTRSVQRQPRDSVQSNLAIFVWFRTTGFIRRYSNFECMTLDRPFKHPRIWSSR